MGLIVSIADFTGSNFIATNTYNEGELIDIIEPIEREFLAKVLGVDMAEDFINDLVAGVPSNPLYVNFFNPFSFQKGYRVHYSHGVKQMLIDFVCAYFNVENASRSTNEGRKVVNGENSSSMKVANLRRFNNGVITARTIQDYIRKNRADYPLFKGVYIETVNPIW